MTSAHPPTVFHIGYQKTGSTTLQQHFFNHLPGCNFVTYYGPAGDAVFNVLSRHLRQAPDDEFLEDTVRAYLLERAARGSGPLVVSDENLAGELWDRDLPPESHAKRLHRLLPEATVLLCVREQGARLRSLYSLYVKQGGSGSFERFLADAAPGYRIDLARMGYDSLVAYYQELFGRDRVVVLAYEAWKADAASYLGAMAHVTGAAPLDPDLVRALPYENRALSRPSRLVMRSSNKLFRDSKFNRKPVVAAVPAAKDLRRQLERVDRRVIPHVSTDLSESDERLADEIASRFAESNARLVELTGLPLADFGYALPRR